MRIQGDNIYLKMLERKDCKTLWNDYEYDFKNPTEMCIRDSVWRL